ncbi:MAG: UvrD-helicase domain-containing protein, partial [Phycisphaerae bacterium]|nr:UvrD-helicase domain-containing protein [Phycisphaerae bacterium]
MKWTKEQQLAIKQRNKDILVSASAGTGKTAVLSGRCIDILSDGTITADVTAMLVLTFTEAAAEQMRSRIGDMLKRELAAKPDVHLRRQLLQLQAADIGTIHSFCKKIITQNFYKLGIDPSFGIIDPDEQNLLKSELLEKTVEWAWQQPNLQQPLNELLTGRNDKFLSNVIRVNDFLNCVIDRSGWFEKAAALNSFADVKKTSLANKQISIIARKSRGVLDQLESLCQLHRRLCPDGKWADSFEQSHIAAVKGFTHLIESGDFNEAAEYLKGYISPRNVKSKEVEPAMAELINEGAKSAIDEFKALKELAVFNYKYLEKIHSAGGRQAAVFVELVKKFDQLYTAAKKTLNSMDFADLERYAMQLLLDEQGQRTETALALQAKYKYIFVDEYQDINPVQQAILSAISCGDNFFAVGDI